MDDVCIPLTPVPPVGLERDRVTGHSQVALGRRVTGGQGGARKGRIGSGVGPGTVEFPEGAPVALLRSVDEARGRRHDLP